MESVDKWVPMVGYRERATKAEESRDVLWGRWRQHSSQAVFERYQGEMNTTIEYRRKINFQENVINTTTVGARPKAQVR